jgi:hypothetical protein
MHVACNCISVHAQDVSFGRMLECMHACMYVWKLVCTRCMMHACMVTLLFFDVIGHRDEMHDKSSVMVVLSP